jgi:hypothetical protein
MAPSGAQRAEGGRVEGVGGGHYGYLHGLGRRAVAEEKYLKRYFSNVFEFKAYFMPRSSFGLHSGAVVRGIDLNASLSDAKARKNVTQ